MSFWWSKLKSKRPSRSRSLRFDRLELRNLMAADVMAEKPQMDEPETTDEPVALEVADKELRVSAETLQEGENIPVMFMMRNSATSSDEQLTEELSPEIFQTSVVDMEQRDSELENPEIVYFSAAGGDCLAHANSESSPWHNNPLPADVNGDGAVSPLDALNLINWIDDYGIGSTPSSMSLMAEGEGPSAMFPDVDGDGVVAPFDFLLLINELNQIETTADPNAIHEAAFASIDCDAGTRLADEFFPIDESQLDQANNANASIAVGEPSPSDTRDAFETEERTEGERRAFWSEEDAIDELA